MSNGVTTGVMGNVSVQAYADNAIPNDIKTAPNRQWASRPADQRFAELADLKAKVEARRAISVVEDVDVRSLKFLEADGQVVAASPLLGSMVPTHWAFGQTASLVGAPASYLRKLPSDIVVQALNHGIKTRGSEGVKLYATDGDEACELRATTSQEYGRVYDADIVDAVEKIVDASDGKFFSPWAWGKQHRALFASDRDVFMFLCDGGSIVDGGGDRDQMHRGFYVWNSEVGSAVFGLAAFMFRSVCGNFLLTGMENARVLKIRHNAGAPERFINEAVPALKAYVNESVLPLENMVRAAKRYMLPAKEDEMFDFFKKQGFTMAEVRRAKQFAEQEEGRWESLWDAQNGFTAAARMLAHADASIALSVRAGKLMELVA